MSAGWERLMDRMDDRNREAAPAPYNPWDELEKDEEFRAELARATADMEAGRWYRMERDADAEDGFRFVPNPDWPKDGPQPREATDAPR